MNQIESSSRGAPPCAEASETAATLASQSAHLDKSQRTLSGGTVSSDKGAERQRVLVTGFSRCPQCCGINRNEFSTDYATCRSYIRTTGHKHTRDSHVHATLPTACPLRSHITNATPNKCSARRPWTQTLRCPRNKTQLTRWPPHHATAPDNGATKTARN